jgi:hypothetical protein
MVITAMIQEAVILVLLIGIFVKYTVKMGPGAMILSLVGWYA